MFALIVLVLVGAVALAAQVPTNPVDNRATLPNAMSVADLQGQPKPGPAKGPERVANYVLGADDTIIIRAFQAEELSEKPIQIGGDGYISLPLVGRVKAAGLTVRELEEDLTERLKNYVRSPQVTVLVSDYRSQPVSVLGAVGNPGVVQLRGRKTLVEVIALAGGLRAEAGNTVTITRELSMGPILLPGAANDPAGRYSIAHVNVRSIMDAHNPQDNILIQANDVIMIPKAQLLYVVGEVQKPGGYVLGDKDTVTVMKAVALAGGLTAKAAPKNAKILYQEGGHANKTEVPTDVRKILAGQSPDIELHADEILFVPSSLPKSAGGIALQTAINMAGAAIFRIP